MKQCIKLSNSQPPWSPPAPLPPPPPCAAATSSSPARSTTTSPDLPPHGSVYHHPVIPRHPWAPPATSSSWCRLLFPYPVLSDVDRLSRRRHTDASRTPYAPKAMLQRQIGRLTSDFKAGQTTWPGRVPYHLGDSLKTMHVRFIIFSHLVTIWVDSTNPTQKLVH
jgi:hypothetical protein